MHVGEPVPGDGWNPGSRRMHRDQAARAAIGIAVAMAALWWFEASLLAQTLVVALAFGVEAWVAWTRRDSVALGAFGIAAGVAAVAVAIAAAGPGNALLGAGLATLAAAIAMKDVYVGGLGVGIAISALRVSDQVAEEVGLQVALALMLAAVLALLHVGVRRMGEEI